MKENIYTISFWVIEGIVVLWFIYLAVYKIFFKKSE